jgi:FemAB-related protein (PEP-CTERM system-associated)
MSLHTRDFEASDATEWDEFVHRHPEGSPFHLVAWKKSIEETFGYRPLYLVAADQAGIRGVLPLFLVQNLLVGKALISSPFAVYGGVLADGDESRNALKEHLQRLGSLLPVDYVELRNAYPGQCVGLSSVCRYVTFTQRIGSDEAAVLEAIPRKTRYMVRKSLKNKFSTRRQATDFLAFEKLYSENLKRLGTPSFPPKHFERLIANFGPGVDIREVLLEGTVAAAVMTFYFRDQVLPYYGAADPRFNALAPSNYMYFDQMRWAAQNGYQIFDFGRSKKESGSFDFKAHWGMQMRDLPYEILLVNRKELPHYSPNNPRFRAAIKLWQRLPLPVTRVLGPPLIRLVP